MSFLNVLFGSTPDAKIQKARSLEARATELKNNKPDEAVNLLEKVEKLQKDAGCQPITMLQTRLRVATILYENEQYKRAEDMLLEEYENAKKWEIGKKESKVSDLKYKQRLHLSSKEGKIQKYEQKRNLDENADFNRNLYCKEIYEKIRIFYERVMKNYVSAIPFAMAEAYSKYENATHNMYCDEPEADFKAVLRCLKKVGMEKEMQSLEEVFWKYAASPDSTKCWSMINEVSNRIKK